MARINVTSSKKISSTNVSISSDGWQTVDLQQKAASPADTRAVSNESVLMMQGRYIECPQGGVQIVITVDPAAVDRKIAIRQMNDRLEGRSPRSDTFIDRKV